MIQFTIRQLGSFEKLFARLSRKAVRLGLTPPTYKKIAERVEEAEVFELTELGRRRVGVENVVVNDIEIEGLDPVRLDGWQFAARVETVLNGQNLIFNVPNITIPERFKTSGCRCDHCSTVRNRSLTFIVFNADTNEWMQVGKSCLADFVGNNSAERVASLFTFWGEILRDLGELRSSEITGWEGGSRAHDLRDVVASSLAVQEQFGWLSRSKAWEAGGDAKATADRLKEDYKGFPPSEANLSKADEVIEYFASLQWEEGESGLTSNARIIANAGFCSDKSFGLACALPACYAIAKKNEAREDLKQLSRERSKHVFSVGQRVKGITATIKATFTFTTQFGVSVKTILEDKDGNVLVAKDLGFEEGEVRFTATVKEHTEYDGVKQTVLLRAANIERVES
jgi:hypothetical protein